MKMEYNIEEINNLEDLKRIKNEFYTNNQELIDLKNQIKTASKEEKNIIGNKIKIIQEEAENFFQKAQIRINNLEFTNRMLNSSEDITLPLLKNSSLHPLTIIENRFKTWLFNNSYYQTVGNEFTTIQENFEALNLPEDHPARDMQDSLFINEQLLLRPHNTGFSALELTKNKNTAFACFSIGKVYRNDEDDATHSHQFSQIDVVNVGNINFANLIWTLKSLLSYVLEQDIQIRLRPSYFPFTEPSCEVDVWFNQRWIEILGAGMVHKNVMKYAGYTNDMTAFAFGIGIERVAMIKYNIQEIREFYKNDFRFLSQFNK